MKRCIVCGSVQCIPLYAGIIRCSKCGHVFADLLLGHKRLKKIYGKKYFFGNEYSNYLKDKGVLQKNFNLRLEVLKKFLIPSRHKHLLEIGCAYGFFLDLAKQQFETVTGIDITEDGILYAQKQLKLNVVKADFLKHNFSKQKVDVVCLWDTIEHLERPNLFLEKISKLTKKGSLIAITTGDINSLNARLRGKSWRLIHPPTHLHYFSGKTLSRLLAQKGFKVTYNRHCGYFRSFDLASYNLFVLHHKLFWIYNLLHHTGLINSDFF